MEEFDFLGEGAVGSEHVPMRGDEGFDPEVGGHLEGFAESHVADDALGVTVMVSLIDRQERYIDPLPFQGGENLGMRDGVTGVVDGSVAHLEEVADITEFTL